MRKLTFLTALLLVMLSANSVFGQYVVTQESSMIAVEKEDGTKVVNITPDNEEGDALSIKVAGFEVLLGDSHNDEIYKKEKKRRFNLASPGHIGFLEIGFNMLPNPDYSIYENMGYGDFLNLYTAKSQQWSLCLSNISMKITKSGFLSFSTALQMLWNNYTLDDPRHLIRDNGIIVPDMNTTNNYSKSKLRTFGFQIPIQLEVNLPKGLFLAGGVYGGINLSSYSRAKSPVVKIYNPYMNMFYYGVTARVGHESFYVYMNYGLSDLFKKDRGPVVSPVTIGVGLSF